MSRTKKFVIGGLVIVALGLVVYVYLGGLNKMEIEEVPVTSSYRFLGKDYTGRPASAEHKNLFFEFRDKITSGEIKGRLAMIHFLDAQTKKGEYKMFVGILLDEIPEDFPEDYRLMGVELDKAIQARIEVHNLVMPSPQTIESRIGQYAMRQGLQLQPISIEIYQQDNTLRVQIPVAK